MKDIINNVIDEYNINGQSFQNLTTKSARVICTDGNCYFIKKTNMEVDEKYKFLHAQNVDNVLYPIQNHRGNYVTYRGNSYFYVMPFQDNDQLIDELKVNHYYKQLSNLHFNSYYRKELTPLESKKKLENIYYYLDYKFNVLEAFVRNVEERTYDEYSILILKNYQYILLTKGIMAKLNYKIINDIKAKKNINRAFIHNNPKLNHLIISESNDYFISLERSKIGIPSLDMAKFYIETEDVKINHKELITDYFKQYDEEFYLNYFYFIVMLYYIKSIVIIDVDYVSSQSFVYAGEVLNKFVKEFDLK